MNYFRKPSGAELQAASASVPPWSLYAEAQRWGYLAVLFLVSTSQFFDRSVISVLLEPIKHEFQVSDLMLGTLGGFCFALFYAGAGIPIARWADRGDRRTVITLCLAIWSAMTMLCGIAQSFWQLVLARVGVGAGESGGIPPAQSLIVDYFPPERRAIALAIFTGGSTAGNLLGSALGGIIAAAYGWRDALLWAGAFGLLLALIVRLTLSEPRHLLGQLVTSQVTESARKSFSALWCKRSFRYALGGWIVYFLFTYGALIFAPSFLIRLLNATLSDASVGYGGSAAAGSLVGTLGGGWLADRLGAQNIQWFAWLPAIACVVTGPIYLVAFATHYFWVFLALNGIGFVALSAGVPSLFVAIHAVCGSHRRATAIALVYFSASLLGSGLGPVLSGALSDALGMVYGSEGLRYALMLMTTMLLISSIAFYKFGRTMPSELEV